MGSNTTCANTAIPPIAHNGYKHYYPILIGHSVAYPFHIPTSDKIQVALCPINLI